MKKGLFKTVKVTKERNAIIAAIVQIFRILIGKPAIEPEKKKLGIEEAEAILDTTIATLGLDPAKDEICTAGNMAIPIAVTHTAAIFGAEITILDDVEAMIASLKADNKTLDEYTAKKIEKLQKKITAIQKAIEIRQEKTQELTEENVTMITKAELVGRFFALS